MRRTVEIASTAQKTHRTERTVKTATCSVAECHICGLECDYYVVRNALLNFCGCNALISDAVKVDEVE